MPHPNTKTLHLTRKLALTQVKGSVGPTRTPVYLCYGVRAICPLLGLRWAQGSEPATSASAALQPSTVLSPVAAQGRSRPLEAVRRPAASLPVPAVRTSMTAVRHAATTRPTHSNAGSRPTPDGGGSPPLRSLDGVFSTPRSHPPAARRCGRPPAPSTIHPLICCSIPLDPNGISQNAAAVQGSS